MNNKFGFVILHYITIEDTINCIRSIQKNIKNINYEIVIVDNASSNGTGKILKEQYKDINNITIILNDKNLGFSGGNNIGYRYAKNSLKCNFIVMLNNDTMILEDTFCEKVIDEYKKSNFALLGPKIILPNNEECVFNENLTTINQLRKYDLKIRIKLLLNYLNLEKLFSKTKIINNSKKRNKLPNIRKKNVVIHGCFWIFSPIFINNFNGLDEKTFLYREEDLLYIKIRKNNLITIYNPEITIFHNESSSTRVINTNNKKKNRFKYKHIIKADKALLKELKEYYKEIK